ncbi:MAG TPA: hypothetical protein VHT21_13095 [Stellaceae bacterium]|jgi:hypothetical protein|nr:hypothetical protein [Stellaceae bacterium]
MYIFLKDSCTKGVRKWSDVYQPEIDKDVRVDGGDREVDVDPDLDNRVMSSAERPHRPWLVPGAGTL